MTRLTTECEVGHKVCVPGWEYIKRLTLEQITSVVDLLTADRRVTVKLDPKDGEWWRRKDMILCSARALKRFLQRKIEPKLACALIAGEVAEGSDLTFTVQHATALESSSACGSRRRAGINGYDNPAVAGQIRATVVGDFKDEVHNLRLRYGRRHQRHFG